MTQYSVILSWKTKLDLNHQDELDFKVLPDCAKFVLT
jgi:hypothetical protein